MVETVVVAGGTYVGRTAKLFDTETELRAYHSEGMLTDGEVIGVHPEIRSYLATAEEGKTYAIGWSNTVGALDVAVYHRAISLGNLAPLDFHELPDPGWRIDHTAQAIIGPDGTSYPIQLTWLVTFIVIMVLLSMFLSMVGWLIGVYKKLNVATTEQISATTAIISQPNGGGFSVNKDTGEVTNEWDAPFDWKILILAGLGIAALIVIMQMRKD